MGELVELTIPAMASDITVDAGGYHSDPGRCGWLGSRRETDRRCRAGSPNLNLTPDEKQVYGQLFKQADSDNVGVVTGEIAVKFFEKTRLDSRVLGEVRHVTTLPSWDETWLTTT